MSKLKPKIHSLSTAELAAQANQLISMKSYREAIEIYKQLLKREPRQEWRDTLALAYLERSKDLAAKAMYKEACMLWENIVNVGGGVIQPDLYIDWLIRTNQYAKAMRAINQFQQALTESGVAERLEALLAMLLLTGNKEILQALPLESNLRQQQPIAQAVLRAYCQGSSENDVREQLKQISFRSPYRDFRQLVSALLKLDSDPSAALPLLERIPAESPYRGLADIIHACASGNVLQTLVPLNPSQQEMVVSLLGLESPQLRLIRQWAVVRQKPNDKALLDFITTHLPVLDHEQARRACLALLPGYPHGVMIYTRLFGALPPFEVHRLQALRAEREHDFYNAIRNWQACVDLLTQQKDNPDNPLCAALILRHMVELTEHSGPDPYYEETPILNYLEKSLELDPDDKATYLKLAESHKQAGNSKDYYQWVEKAVQQFPDDSQVLLVAVEAATERKAFKKAVNFATKLLELDPINNRARTILINSHLAHARKLIKSGKYSLAEKELTSASHLEREGAHRGSVEINRGLLAFQLGQQDRMQHELREGTRLAGGVLQARLRLWVEACQLDLEPEDFQHYAQPEEGKIPVTRDDVLALVKLVNEYRQEGVDFLDTALENLEVPLKKFASQLSTEEDLLGVCECLQRAPHYELLEHFASQALKYWQRPLFVYYQIYGRAEGKLDNVSDKDYQRLERAWEQAQQAQDHRTARLINEFLSQDFAPFLAPSSKLPPLPADVREDLDRLTQELRGMPPPLLDKALDDLLDKLGEKTGGLPRELGKLMLKAILTGELPQPAHDFPELPDDFPSPFDLPTAPRPKRKKARRKR
jgi:tetratricopeptide (TPR) repeat protein